MTEWGHGRSRAQVSSQKTVSPDLVHESGKSGICNAACDSVIRGFGLRLHCEVENRLKSWTLRDQTSLTTLI